jgi:hypothetical protein
MQIYFHFWCIVRFYVLLVYQKIPTKFIESSFLEKTILAYFCCAGSESVHQVHEKTLKLLLRGSERDHKVLSVVFKTVLEIFLALLVRLKSV